MSWAPVMSAALEARVAAGKEARRLQNLVDAEARRQRRVDWENGGEERYQAEHSRCSHGLPVPGDCAGCKREALSVRQPVPASTDKRCRSCGAPGAVRRNYVDLCASCWEIER